MSYIVNVPTLTLAVIGKNGVQTTHLFEKNQEVESHLIRKEDALYYCNTFLEDGVTPYLIAKGDNTQFGIEGATSDKIETTEVTETTDKPKK